MDAPRPGTGPPLVEPGQHAMRLSLGRKVFLTLFLTLAALAVLLLGLTRYSLGVGFSRYVTQVELTRLDPLAAMLEGMRQARGTWAFLPRPPADLRRWLAQQEPAGGVVAPHLDLADRLSVLNADGERMAGADPPGASRRPLTVEGRTVGFLALQPVAEAAALDREFLQDQQRNLLLLGVAALILAAGAGMLLTGNLQKAIQDLVRGTHRLASGDFTARIPADRQDELGDLARDFNALAESLKNVEAQRRQWVADTSHELRTPVAVLRAQIEAMQDGVHPTTPETLNVLHEQVLALARLVDDLHLLARGDAHAVTCRLQPLDLAGLVRDALQAQATRFEKAGLTVEARLPDELVLPGDRSRLRQVLANLMENATRYTDRGGTVRVTLTRQGGHALLALEDSAPGVPPEAYERLFERFYRVDPSRTREQGGTGLGLSICRSLVEAHGGTIQALPSELGGLRLEVRLKLA